MRICFYTDTFFPLVGGAEMVLHHLATELTRMRHEPVILAPHVKHEQAHPQTDYAVHRYAQPSSKRYFVHQTLVNLLWLQQKYHFDVLHCHAGYPQAYVGATFKRLHHLPMVVRPHGSDIVPGGRIRRNSRLEHRLVKALTAADAVVAQGEYLRDLLLELGVTEKKIHVIHNGVDVDSYRSHGKFAHPRPYIVAIGNLIRRKGFDLLLHAYARLDDPGIDLLVAGSGPEHAALTALAHELGISERVRFLGHVSGQEKIDLLASAMLCVCPSRNEPFANVILESLAASIPVVASAVGGNTQLIAHGERGLLFPSEDISALADSIRMLVRDANLREKMSGSIKSFIEQHDWKIVARQYLSLYEKLLEENG